MLLWNRSRNIGNMPSLNPEEDQAARTADQKAKLQAIGKQDLLTEVQIRRAMRPRGRRFWFTGAVILLALSALLQTPLLVLAAMLVLAVGLVPEVWLRVSLAGVRFRRTFSEQRVAFGERFTVSYAVENRKPIPLPWLEVEDESADALQYERGQVFTSYLPTRQIFITTFTLRWFQRVTRRYALRGLGRGVWVFGPTYLRAGDPFGFITTDAQVTTRLGQSSVTVLPLIAPLERFGLPARNPFGERTTARQWLLDPSQVIGARDYQPEDPFRRIHWKATARANRLQSKIYPPTIEHVLAIFLDTRTTPNVTMGIEPALLELGIAAAASTAAWGTGHKLAVGIMSNGLPSTGANDAYTGAIEALASMRVPPGRHPDQLARLLDLLAQLQPYFSGSMDQTIAREEGRLPIGATIVYIAAAAAVRPEVVQRLRRLRRRGHAVTVLLTGHSPAETGDLPTYRLGGEKEWHALIEYATRAYRRDPGSADDDEHSAGDAADGAAAGDAAVRQDSADSDRRQPVIRVG